MNPKLLDGIRFRQSLLLAEMAGVMSAWKDHDGLPMILRERMAELDRRDEKLRDDGEAALKGLA